MADPSKRRVEPPVLLDSWRQVDFVWSRRTGIAHESIPTIPAEIADLIDDVSIVGKLVE